MPSLDRKNNSKQVRGETRIRMVKDPCRKDGCELYGQVHPKCRAHNRAGQPCGGVPLPGQFVCYFHGGMSREGLERGERRLALLDARRQVTAAHLVDFDPNFQETPEEGLLREVAHSAQISAALGLAVAQMEGPLTTFSAATGERMRALYDAWASERQLHARLCKLALDAGVAQRSIDLAEKQAEIVVEVLVRVLQDDRLGLSDDAVIEAKLVAVDVLRALPQARVSGTPVGARRVFEAEATALLPGTPPEWKQGSSEPRS